MRVVLQRVSEARVRVADVIVGEIGPGLLLLVGVAAGDTAALVAPLAEKVARLRVFEDDTGKMNRAALDVGAAALVVPQFTLYADTSRGRRPSFGAAAAPDLAAPLVDAFAAALRVLGLPVATGRFGAHMRVESVNDGPVTIILESAPA